jgi:hypothetical protein
MLIVGLLSAATEVSADIAGRPEDGTPDATYTNVQGDSQSETKGGAGPQGGGGFSIESVTWPYSNFGWSITSWYSTSDGLRFYGVYFNSEQIFYDYRVPWVKIGANTYALTTARLSTGPDLLVYNAGSFLVKAKYALGSPNVDITVSTRFYSNGTIEPWVLVDGKGSAYSMVVPQRFDFDLGGADDDNQQYYSGSAWSYSATEHHTADASYGEDANHYQWKTFDTDQSGSTYVTDQAVNVIPYHPDGATWYHLRYNSGEIGGTPSSYENSQTINTYNSGQADPWVGQDAVNWYVSTYSSSSLAYPGPWLETSV